MTKKCGICGEAAAQFRDASDDPGVRAAISFLWELGRWRSSGKQPSKGDIIKCAELICLVCYVELKRMLLLNCFQNPLMKRIADYRGWKDMTRCGMIPQLKIRWKMVESDWKDASANVVGRLRDCGKHCFCCGLLFTDEMTASLHINQKHSKREPLSCGYCPEDFKLKYMNLDMLNQHAMATHFSPEYTNGSSSSSLRRKNGVVKTGTSVNARLLEKLSSVSLIVKKLTEEEIKTYLGDDETSAHSVPIVASDVPVALSGAETTPEKPKQGVKRKFSEIASPVRRRKSSTSPVKAVPSRKPIPFLQPHIRPGENVLHFFIRRGPVAHPMDSPLHDDDDDGF